MDDDINFVETDSDTIQNDLINDFENSLGETLYPGDERRIFLLQEIPAIVGLKNDINESAKENLLRYATGEKLDALGEFYNTPRIPAKYSKVTLRFILSAAQPSNTTIPSGTRATPDGLLYFITSTDLIIPAGQTQGDVIAQAAESGGKYNDYASGQIKNLVDPLPYITSVSNTDSSNGGADIESDDDGINTWSGYRERIREAPESFSTAGPEGAYIYWAKTASVDISDIAVLSPSAGVVSIIILMKNGQLPSQDILDSVLAICSAKDKRPLTDNVQVSAPTTVSYDINLTYYISKDRQTEEVSIKNKIEGTGGAIEQYKSWQCSALGRAVNPDYLRQLILDAGAFRIDITSPSYTSINEDQVAISGTLTIAYGGLI